MCMCNVKPCANYVPMRLYTLGIHYRGVQWEGGAVDGGSVI